MDPMRTPSSIGARAEAAVASALVRAGRHVYVPAFSTHARVDLVYLDGNRPVRVQCKSAYLIKDTLRFFTCSNTGNVQRPYHGEVDEFGVFSPDVDTVYLVPIRGLPLTACYLRLTATRNGQSAGIRWAHEFEHGPP